jgi:hypothetical protein
MVKYKLNDQVKENEMGRICSMHREKSFAYMVYVGKAEGRRPPAKPGCRWEDNIKIDFREIGWNDRH